ncbi:MAG: hypothetical protein KTR31_19825 [Myxococcales bacterium]|nr:hypothetical protein [Myxococcales bacterium]
MNRFWPIFCLAPLLGACASDTDDALREIQGIWLRVIESFVQPSAPFGVMDTPCERHTSTYTFSPQGRFTRREATTQTAACWGQQTVSTVEVEGSYETFLFDDSGSRLVDRFRDSRRDRVEIDGEVVRDSVELDVVFEPDIWSSGADDDGRFLVLLSEGVFRAE